MSLGENQVIGRLTKVCGRELFEVEYFGPTKADKKAPQPEDVATGSQPEPNSNTREGKISPADGTGVETLAQTVKQIEISSARSEEKTGEGGTKTAADNLVRTLARLPSKFKHLVWVRIGSYVILDPTDETGTTHDAAVKSSLISPSFLPYLDIFSPVALNCLLIPSCR